ncbi:vegetative incompatibility protein HET-E-1, partial [Podospora australis]
MSDPHKYAVGWICAIPTESVAAGAFLDEEHPGPTHVAQHDNNSYILGRIGSHNIVIATLPDGEYGTNSAAAVSRDMLHSFPNVRIGLMVGIGGGAPTAKHDIRLGDIVVSSRAGGSNYGGVLQYDFGKSIQDKEFRETGYLNQPPMVLRTAVSTLKGIYERKGHRLAESVETALGNIKKQKKYVRPAPETDKLYKSDFAHLSDSDGSCAVVCGEDKANLVTRDKRDEEDDDPAIHYGLIASGNQLMKDARVRDRLAHSKGVMCFEMEASGLMNHFPCLVIRGICDYSDSHKNKDWQGFAAMMAAAYAKDLLSQIALNKVEGERRLAEVMKSVEQGLGGLEQKMNELNRGRHFSEVEKWLKPVDTSTNYNQARQKSHQGTGKWFLDSHEFTEWKQGSRSHLWLHGFAGCGKTVLTSTIVDQLQKMDDVITIAFYFDFSNTAKQTVDALLRSLVFQLHKRKPNIKELDKLYQRLDDGSRQPNTEDLISSLQALMKDSKTIFIILDALDECIEKQQLIKWMETLTAPDLSNVHVLVTSRPEEEFRRWIPSRIGQENCMPLDREAVNDDIRSYVTATLQESPDFVDKKLSEELQEQIRQKVGNGAKGMFRWAACQLKTLGECTTPFHIKNALSMLPRDLNETYDRMVESIPKNNLKDAIRLLQFLVHWEFWRPLTLKQAIEIIATSPDDTEEELGGFHYDRRPFEDAVPKYCPNLVSVVEVKSGDHVITELHLAHFSVKEYLLKREEFNLKNASIRLSKTCINYLEGIEDSEGLISEEDGSDTMEYCATMTWTRYYTLAESIEDDSLIQKAIAFIENDSSFSRLFRYEEDVGSKLYYVCKNGLLAVSRRLIEQGADVNAQGGHFGNALQAAASGGHQAVVQLLLEKGADVNAQGGGYGNALQAAASGGHQAVVQLLLEKGADVNAQGG